MTNQPFEFIIKKKKTSPAPNKSNRITPGTVTLQAPKYPIFSNAEITKLYSDFKDSSDTIDVVLKNFLQQHTTNVQNVFVGENFSPFSTFIANLTDKVVSSDFGFENTHLIEKENSVINHALKHVNKKIGKIEHNKNKARILIDESKTENKKYENIQNEVAEFCNKHKLKIVNNKVVDENNKQLTKDYVYNIAKKNAANFNSYINRIMMKLKVLGETLNEKIKEEDKLFEDAYGEFAGNDESFITKIN